MDTIWSNGPGEFIMDDGKLNPLQRKAFLRALMENESSGGKNLEHPLMKTGIHSGDRAVGRWAIMPETIKEVAGSSKNPKIRELLKKDKSEYNDLINKNPELEEQIVNELLNKVDEKFPTVDQKAYAWNQGHNISPEKLTEESVEKNPYVQKFKENYKEPPVNNFGEQFKPQYAPKDPREEAIEPSDSPLDYFPYGAIGKSVGKLAYKGLPKIAGMIGKTEIPAIERATMQDFGESTLSKLQKGAASQEEKAALENKLKNIGESSDPFKGSEGIDLTQFSNVTKPIENSSPVEYIKNKEQFKNILDLLKLKNQSEGY